MAGRSTTLRAAVIGARHPHIGEFFKAARETDGVRLVGLAEDDPRLAQQYREKWEVPVYATGAELIERERPDVVGVAVVGDHKADAIVDCLGRGIHVLVDKPLVTTFADLERARDAATSSSARLSLMLTCRFDPGWRAIHSLIEQGELGRIVHAFALAPHRLRPAGRGPWMLDDTQNGGILVDIAIHSADLLRWYVGEDPTRVVAAHGNLRFRELANFTDHGHALLSFPGGAVGQIAVDWLTPEAAPYHGDYRNFVTGTRGYVELRAADRPPTLLVVTEERPLRQLELPAAGPNVCEDFLQAIRDDREPGLSLDDVLRSSALSLYLRESAATGRPLDLSWRTPLGAAS